MKESITLKFYLYLAPGGQEHKLYLRIVVDRKKSELCLGYTIDPLNWDEERQRTKKDKKLNEELAFIENKIFQIKRDLNFANKPISARIIKDTYLGKVEAYETIVKYYESYIRKLKSIPTHSVVMAEKHQNSLNKIVAYLTSLKKTDILITEINYKWIQDYDRYLLTFINSFINKPISRNTANKEHARLKTVLDECIKEEILKSDPYFNVTFKSNKSSREYLDSQELEIIQNHSLGNNLSLQKVRDVFIFSVYTGLRYIDAMALKSASVKKDEQGNFWIEFLQIKTSEKVKIPLLKKAYEIFLKYESERKITGNILPRISNQKVNAYLKTIGEITGITKKLTHHVARHTCATTVLLDNNVPMEVVSKWLGHNSIKTTQIYGKITSKKLSDYGKKLNEEL